MLDTLVFVLFFFSIVFKTIFELSVRFPKFPFLSIKDYFLCATAFIPFIPLTEGAKSKGKIIVNACVMINIICFLYLITVAELKLN